MEYENVGFVSETFRKARKVVSSVAKAAGKAASGAGKAAQAAGDVGSAILKSMSGTALTGGSQNLGQPKVW